jgi:ribonuclease BN (tRNA processing enzyme)
VNELVILGSGCGFATQDRFSTSIALLVDPNLYLFDCGEPCAALLFRHGIDAAATKALFISHMHHDHVSGLAAVLSSISVARRSTKVKFRPWSIDRDAPWYRSAISFPRLTAAAPTLEERRSPIQLVIPAEATEALQVYLPAVCLDPSNLPFELNFSPVREGVTFSDERVRVTAVSSSHLSANPAHAQLKSQPLHLALQSYSYAVAVDKTKVVFSGDLTTLDELNPLLQDAELLIVEVAHYDPQEIGPFVRDLPLRRIVLTHIHPGLEERLPDLVRAWRDPRIQIAYDGKRIPLDQDYGGESG